MGVLMSSSCLMTSSRDECGLLGSSDGNFADRGVWSRGSDLGERGEDFAVSSWGGESTSVVLISGVLISGVSTLGTSTSGDSILRGAGLGEVAEGMGS